MLSSFLTRKIIDHQRTKPPWTGRHFIDTQIPVLVSNIFYFFALLDSRFFAYVLPTHRPFRLSIIPFLPFLSKTCPFHQSLSISFLLLFFVTSSEFRKSPQYLIRISLSLFLHPVQDFEFLFSNFLCTERITECITHFKCLWWWGLSFSMVSWVLSFFLHRTSFSTLPSCLLMSRISSIRIMMRQQRDDARTLFTSSLSWTGSETRWVTKRKRDASSIRLTPREFDFSSLFLRSIESCWSSMNSSTFAVER